MYSLKFLVVGVFLVCMEAHGFDLVKAVLNDQLSRTYWNLENNVYTFYSDLTAGIGLQNELLPSAQTSDPSTTQIPGLLAHFFSAIDQMETSISFASSEDIEAVAEVHFASWNAAYKQVLPFRSQNDFRNLWSKQLHSPPSNHKTLILKAGSRVVAFCGYQSLPNSTIEIIGLYVHPAFQRLGAGSKLLEYLKTLIKPGSLFFLWVYEKNEKAIQFYQKQGFERSGGETKKYKDTDIDLWKLKYAFN
ncbi:GNAT family N-acetyltransferase [Endozoicomonas arenosclerae]|uniref:GNAT family N-acetyltransferase n=1 Tax=Endozoicomonas arenosclerae TaxID=1633495 RepID=UPI000784B92F|nr:GNAT family N-acetyltransferase [Endozoicomonas arenosclerae]